MAAPIEVEPNEEPPPLTPIEPRLHIAAPPPQAEAQPQQWLLSKHARHHAASKPTAKSSSPAVEPTITKKKKNTVVYQLYKHHPAPPPGSTAALTNEEELWVEHETLLFWKFLLPMVLNNWMKVEMPEEYEAKMKAAHARRVLDCAV